MGSFYGNITLLDTNLASVRAAIAGPAFGFEEAGAVVVFAEADDDGGPVNGEALSRSLGCVAFSAGVHDDDIFFYEVHRNGDSIAGGAIPDPTEYFGIDPGLVDGLDPARLEEMGAPVSSPEGSAVDPGALVDALGRGNEVAVRAAFEDDFVFATERHGAVVEALGLPSGAVGWGYRYVVRDRSGYPGPALTDL